MIMFDCNNMLLFLTAIFIGMITPEWPRVLHKLAHFSSKDPRNTHGY